jgi:chromate transporter
LVSQTKNANVSLLDLVKSFGLIGATAWGGAYAALPRVEVELIHRRGWITEDELHELMAVAALVPGPTFGALAGLVGYRLRGAIGSALCIMGLIAPSAAVVVLIAMAASAETLAGPLAPLRRSVAVAVLGITVGASWRLYAAKAAKSSRHTAIWGTVVLVAVTASLGFGLPALWVTLGGLVVGMWLLKEKVSK